MNAHTKITADRKAADTIDLEEAINRAKCAARLASLALTDLQPGDAESTNVLHYAVDLAEQEAVAAMQVFDAFMAGGAS